MDRPADEQAIRLALGIVDHRRAEPFARTEASPATASTSPRSRHSARDSLAQRRAPTDDGEAPPRRRAGRARSPPTAARPAARRSSARSRGRVWRAGMALPIARAMTDAATRLATVRAEIARAAKARAPRSGRGHAGRGVEAPLGRGDRGADRRRPARLRRKPGPGSAGQMAGAACRASATSAST